MTHEIKSDPIFFEARWDGRKSWEFRRNDRGYDINHHLHERECLDGNYTGRHILSRITYFLGESGVEYGIPEGFCVMSLEIVAKGKWLPREKP